MGSGKIDAKCITRPTLHAADLFFVRTVNIGPHAADVHRADHKKFDTLQTLHGADINFLTRCRRYLASVRTFYINVCADVFFENLCRCFKD